MYTIAVVGHLTLFQLEYIVPPDEEETNTGPHSRICTLLRIMKYDDHSPFKPRQQVAVAR